MQKTPYPDVSREGCLTCPEGVLQPDSRGAVFIRSHLMGGEPSYLTMSSREIADLVGLRHDNVKRTIETLISRGVIVQPQVEDEHSTDALGRPRSTEVYLVNQRDSYVIVAQLSPEFTGRLVDRWFAIHG